MSSEGSDIEIQSALPKKTTKKTPKSPSEDILSKNQDGRKVSTKEMIRQALIDLKTRKGTSLYAIKKYIETNYDINVEKSNYLIKKSLKSSVESGLVVQTKGIGASGSFKLAPGKDKVEKKKIKKKTDKPKKKEKLTETEITEKTAKPKKVKVVEKLEKPKKKVEIAKSSKTQKKDKKVEGEKESKMKKGKSVKIAKGIQTPAKKRAAIMKRKSIGSIIKPPKMKPKAK